MLTPHLRYFINDSFSTEWDAKNWPITMRSQPSVWSWGLLVKSTLFTKWGDWDGKRENKVQRKWCTGYVSSRVTWPAETCHWFSNQPHPLGTNECFPEREYWRRLVNGQHPNEWAVFRKLSQTISLEGHNMRETCLAFITIW